MYSGYVLKCQCVYGKDPTQFKIHKDFNNSAAKKQSSSKTQGRFWPDLESVHITTTNAKQSHNIKTKRNHMFLGKQELREGVTDSVFAGSCLSYSALHSNGLCYPGVLYMVTFYILRFYAITVSVTKIYMVTIYVTKVYTVVVSATQMTMTTVYVSQNNLTPGLHGNGLL